MCVCVCVCVCVVLSVGRCTGAGDDDDNDPAYSFVRNALRGGDVAYDANGVPIVPGMTQRAAHIFLIAPAQSAPTTTVVSFTKTSKRCCAAGGVVAAAAVTRRRKMKQGDVKRMVQNYEWLTSLVKGEQLTAPRALPTGAGQITGATSVAHRQRGVC